MRLEGSFAGLKSWQFTVCPTATVNARLVHSK
jgi:hypothetical protein